MTTFAIKSIYRINIAFTFAFALVSLAAKYNVNITSVHDYMLIALYLVNIIYYAVTCKNIYDKQQYPTH